MEKYGKEIYRLRKILKVYQTDLTGGLFSHNLLSNIELDKTNLTEEKGMIVFTNLIKHSLDSFTFLDFDFDALLLSNINYVNAPINKAITSGIYKISRNPMYFFSFLIVTGIALMSSSWVLFFIMLVYGLITHQIIKSEEYYCLKTYSLVYREYMKKTARYFLFI